eukprot:TRINITY_DN110791_c0_g1_i1.p1 TRINITY_DN110791_c0_g1~~TRINITY_DN110791_c0_g1_i1.p1  ORF type:complete len:307 (+),score=49.09 TRINITY_DN110791_c0_g1_i1:71-991(+)
MSWDGAVQTLEDYSQALNTSNFDNCEQVCLIHGPKLAQAASRLPHNAPARLLPGEAGSTVGPVPPVETKHLPSGIPTTAPAMVRNLLRTLQPIWNGEVQLTPEPLLSCAQCGHVLMATEVLAAELGELLQSAPEWHVRQQGEWAVVGCIERLAAFLRWLTGNVTRTCEALIVAGASTDALEAHARCLGDIASLVNNGAVFMQMALGTMDAARPVAGRLGAAALALDQAAEELKEKASQVMKKELEERDPGSKRWSRQKNLPAGTVVGHGVGRSIMSILAGRSDWSHPAEERRKEGLQTQLQVARGR